jgi:hypothetical protein
MIIALSIIIFLLLFRRAAVLLLWLFIFAMVIAAGSLPDHPSPAPAPIEHRLSALPPAPAPRPQAPMPRPNKSIALVPICGEAKMKLKLLEVRDKGTFIPAFAFSTEREDNAKDYLLWRCGFSDDGSSIMFGFLSGERKACIDSYAWGDRTMHVAHTYVIEHWAELQDGDVIDVQVILGETLTLKVSERHDRFQGSKRRLRDVHLSRRSSKIGE